MTKKRANFEAAPGACFNNAQAQEIGGYLWEHAQKRMEEITTKEVVELARPKDSPIHNYFNWDDSSAAECWRKQQARQILNHLILVTIIEGEEKRTRAFYNVRISEDANEEEGRVYVTPKKVANTEYYHQQMLAKALGEIKAWQIRYKEINELSDIFGAIRKTQKRLGYPEKEMHVSA